MITLFLIPFFISYVLLVWFDTNAFTEYAELFKLGKIFKIGVYREEKERKFSLTYPEFLAQYYHLFIFRLLGCPICICFWCGLWGALVYATGWDILLYMSFFNIVSLFIYYLLSKLIKSL